MVRFLIRCYLSKKQNNMAIITFKINGFSQLQKNFRKAPQVTFKELNKAIKIIGWMVTRKAKEVTPVLTGALRGSIRPSFQPLKTIIEPHKNYGIYVHEGTKHMKPRPFLKWGLENSVTDIETTLSRAVQKVLNIISKI